MQTFTDFDKTYNIAKRTNIHGKISFQVEQFNTQGHKTGEMTTDAAWLEMMGFEYKELTNVKILKAISALIKNGKKEQATSLANGLSNKTKFVTVFRHIADCATTESEYSDSMGGYYTQGFKTDECCEPVISLAHNGNDYDLFIDCFATHEAVSSATDLVHVLIERA